MSLLDDLLRNAEEAATLINQERDKIEGQLTIYRIPKGTTRICENCFFGSNLSEIVIPNSVTYIDEYAFAFCENLTDIVLPNALTAIGRYAFRACTSLVEISIPATVTFISGTTFETCTALTDVTLPNTLEAIGWYAFAGCTSLEEIEIPLSVWTFGSHVFRECTKLSKINLPKLLTTIGERIFSDCRSLEFVTLEDGFNCNGLDLSPSTLYSVETIVSWLNALADRTGETAYTLTVGTSNLNKLTAEQRAIATNKNWNLA